MISQEARKKGKAITEGMFWANPKVQLSEIMAELGTNNLHIPKSTVNNWLIKLREKAEPPTFPFEQIIEAVVRAFEQAKMVPILTETVSHQENIIAAQKNEIKVLEKDLQEATDAHLRYKVAIQQGEVPVPEKKERT